MDYKPKSLSVFLRPSSPNISISCALRVSRVMPAPPGGYICHTISSTSSLYSPLAVSTWRSVGDTQWQNWQFAVENKLFTLERDINDMLEAGDPAFRYTCIIGLRVHCLLTDILARGGGIPAEFSAIQPCSEVILFTKIYVFWCDMNCMFKL